MAKIKLSWWVLKNKIKYFPFKKRYLVRRHSVHTTAQLYKTKLRDILLNLLKSSFLKLRWLKHL
jgi:hypothetical protein